MFVRGKLTEAAYPQSYKEKANKEKSENLKIRDPFDMGP